MRRKSDSEFGSSTAETTAQLLSPATEEKSSSNDATSSKSDERKTEILWLNVTIWVILHSIGVYGVYLALTSANIRTVVYYTVVGIVSTFGVSVGCHRLWSHRSFKATLPMRILLMLMQTSAIQDAIYFWVRDHRVHHKYTDTNADPYNSSRGFFFSHMGWLMCRRHPDIKKMGKGIDLSDLTSDPVVAFQKKYYYVLALLVSFVIPILVPMYFWNETFTVAFFTTILRWLITLHLVWCINSVSHYWGYKSYDVNSSATDNPYTGILMIGESWHNYHHAFPWDYTVPETPLYTFHASAAFIDFFSLFGLTYDLKSVSRDLAIKQANTKGDGTFKISANRADTND